MKGAIRGEICQKKIYDSKLQKNVQPRKNWTNFGSNLQVKIQQKLIYKYNFKK